MAMVKVIKGVNRKGVIPERGTLIVDVIIECPAIILRPVLAESIEVTDAKNDDPILTTTLFGEKCVTIGEQVQVIGNVQSNGTILIKDNSVVLGHVIGDSVVLENKVKVMGNVIARKDIVLGDDVNVGGYVASLRGRVKTGKNVTVYDIISYRDIELGNNTVISDYAIYSLNGTVKLDGVLQMGSYKVNLDNFDVFREGTSLNLFKVLDSPVQYSWKERISELKAALGSIKSINEYLKEKGIDISKIRNKSVQRQIRETIRTTIREIIHELPPKIEVKNISGPVAISVGGQSIAIGGHKN